MRAEPARRSPASCSLPSSRAIRSGRRCRRSPPRPSTSPRRWSPSATAGGSRCSSSSTVRRQPSRISARAFSPPAFSRLRGAAARPLTILVATSGDTGGAVAAAFHGRPGIEVAVLFPKGLVSPTQERQLTCWGGNVRAFAVRGTFDDCQRLVKQAFLDRALRGAPALLGQQHQPRAAAAAERVLRRRESRGLADTASAPPSSCRAATSATRWHVSGRAGWGCRSREVVLAHNANRTVPDFLDSGDWQPRAEHRHAGLRHGRWQPEQHGAPACALSGADEMRSAVSAYSVTDAQIRARIRTGYEEYGQIWCPHTATAAEACARLRRSARAQRPLGAGGHRASGQVSARSSSR